MLMSFWYAFYLSSRAITANIIINVRKDGLAVALAAASI